GGLYNYGVIYSFDLSTGAYTDLYDFDGTHGSTPQCGLIQASNDKLYGRANLGGLNNIGVIFSFDINTSAYTDVFDFDSINGYHSIRELSQLSNGKLIGTTVYGGANNVGVAFSFDITT